MRIGSLELRALAGSRPISPALRRMADRENTRHMAQPSVPRPRIYPQGEDGFYEAGKQRLKRLQDRPCPYCGKPLEFTGISLVCPSGHGWLNARVAEDECGEATKESSKASLPQ